MSNVPARFDGHIVIYQTRPTDTDTPCAGGFQTADRVLPDKVPCKFSDSGKDIENKPPTGTNYAIQVAAKRIVKHKRGTPLIMSPDERRAGQIRINILLMI